MLVNNGRRTGTQFKGEYVAPLARCSPIWEGPMDKKPWEYDVTVVLPHFETPETLPTVIELLRLQTVSPYMLLIDTGSSKETCEYLETLRALDLEIHYVRGHGYPHNSDPVAIAQDLAFALCRTTYLFCTHVDCWLMRRDFVEDLIGICDENRPAVGYQMSPRDWITDEWEGMVSHTATVLYMPVMHRTGASWSLERAHYQFGIDRNRGGWPDTETTFNLVLRENGITPFLIGEETNFERHTDDNIDHCRSYPGAKTYDSKHYEKAKPWVEDAIQQAKGRISAWSKWDSGIPVYES